MAWTLLLRPRGGFVDGPPPWPALVVDRFGEVALGPVPSIQRVLEGPLPNQVLSRGETEQARWVLSGLGRLLGITVVVANSSGAPPAVQEGLRRQAVAELVGKQSEAEANVTERIRLLVEDEPSWEFVGLVEVLALLKEGTTPELPEENGWDELNGLVVGRGAGTNLGHVAWELSGWYSSATEQGVMLRRLQVLLEGHLTKPSALVCFGAVAASWGATVGDLTRRASALESVLDEVRLAASWAISGGPAVGLDEASYLSLATRLETLRVSLEEDVQRLRLYTERLAAPTQRILGMGRVASPVGAFMESSSRATELLSELDSRLQLAARWSETLHLAGKLLAQGR